MDSNELEDFNEDVVLIDPKQSKESIADDRKQYNYLFQKLNKFHWFLSILQLLQAIAVALERMQPSRPLRAQFSCLPCSWLAP